MCCIGVVNCFRGFFKPSTPVINIKENSKKEDLTAVKTVPVANESFVIAQRQTPESNRQAISTSVNSLISFTITYTGPQENSSLTSLPGTPSTTINHPTISSSHSELSTRSLSSISQKNNRDEDLVVEDLEVNVTTTVMANGYLLSPPTKDLLARSIQPQTSSVRSVELDIRFSTLSKKDLEKIADASLQ